MKTKTFVILLILLGLLGGAGALIIYINSAGSSPKVLGTLLLEDLPANEVASITIETPQAEVSMEKEGDLWVVRERFGYPADFSKITDLVRTLKRVKVGRRFDASEDVLKRLTLRFPDEKGVLEDEKGTRISMKDRDGKLLLSILLGKTRVREKQRSVPEGQYVMLGKGPQVYLVDTILSSFESGPSEWLAKSPVKVDGGEVKSITCTGPGGGQVIYRFERPEKGKPFELVEPTSDGKIKRSSLNRLSNALSSLKIDDVKDPSHPPESISREKSPLIEYRLFNGLIYRIYPGKTCQEATPCYIRIGVDYQEPTPVKGEKDESSAPDKKGAANEKKAEKSGEELAAMAKDLNDRVGPWVFIIPQWQHNAFFTGLDKMLEKEKPKEKGPPAK